MKFINVALAVAMLALGVSCRPQDDSVEVVKKHEEDGYVDLLDIHLEVGHEQQNPTDIPEQIQEIIAEDWADTWDAPKELQEWFPYRITGKDDDGAVVFWKEFGKWKFSELVEKNGTDSRGVFDKYYEQYLHRFLKEGAKNGALIIFDWDGFTLNNFNNREGLKLALRQLTTLEKTSKVLKYTYMINTNFAAQTLMNIAKPLMGGVLENAEIYGTQKSKWLPKLLKKLPRDIIPAHYLTIENKN